MKTEMGKKKNLADFNPQPCLAFAIQGCGIAGTSLCWAHPARHIARGVHVFLGKGVDCL